MLYETKYKEKHLPATATQRGSKSSIYNNDDFSYTYMGIVPKGSIPNHRPQIKLKRKINVE